MATFMEVHPVNPQQRTIERVVKVLGAGGVIAYPTDSGYALGCLMRNPRGADRIRAIRELDDRHHMTVVVSEFAQLGQYVHMDNWVFRAVKAATPGPYTFILPATREVPRAMQHPKKKTIGVRVPDHVTTLALLDAVNEPLVSSTLILPGETEPMTDGWLVNEALGNLVDAVLDSGDTGSTPTTVIDLSGDEPVVVRRGGGDPSMFED